MRILPVAPCDRAAKSFTQGGFACGRMAVGR